LNDLHKTDEAFEVALKAKRLADTSGSWVARYLVRRTLAAGYENRGEFEKRWPFFKRPCDQRFCTSSTEFCSWASLASSGSLVDVGGWEEARDAVNVSLPIFRQFKDTDSEISAYIELMDIYGARESELKDL
jgi:hypothetical protein